VEFSYKVASVYFIEINIYILALEMASSGNQHCAYCIGTLSFPIDTQTLMHILQKSNNSPLPRICALYARDTADVNYLLIKI